MRGVSRRPAMEAGAAPRNQVTHGLATVMPACAARSRQSRFCAAAVRKRIDENEDACARGPVQQGSRL